MAVSKQSTRLTLLDVGEDKGVTRASCFVVKVRELETQPVDAAFAEPPKYLDTRSFRHIKTVMVGFFNLIINTSRSPSHAKSLLIPQILVNMDSMRMCK